MLLSDISNKQFTQKQLFQYCQGTLEKIIFFLLSFIFLLLQIYAPLLHIKAEMVLYFVNGFASSGLTTASPKNFTQRWGPPPHCYITKKRKQQSMYIPKEKQHFVSILSPSLTQPLLLETQGLMEQALLTVLLDSQSATLIQHLGLHLQFPLQP